MRTMRARGMAWLGVLVAMVLTTTSVMAEDDDDGGGGGGGGAAAEPAGGDDGGDDAPAPAADRDVDGDGDKDADGSGADGSGSGGGDADDDKDADGSGADGSGSGGGDADDDKDADGSGADGSGSGGGDADDDKDADGSGADGSGSADADADPDADADADAGAGDEDTAEEFIDEEPKEGELIDADGDGDADVPYYEFDEDGDGVVEPDEAELKAEFEAAFADIPDEVDDAALDARPDASALLPSLDVETFRKLVRLAEKKVLPRMETKIEAKNAKKMMKFVQLVVAFSGLGILLLLAPLFLAKKYPGKGGMLFKYAAIAAATFVVTVNLFGVVLLGLRTAQGAMGRYTNPQLAVASGLFTTLDEDAEEYIVLGKELFAPTLEQMHAGGDDPPAAVVIANGQRVVKDASVFISIAKFFKGLNWLFGIIPIVLTVVTLLLFVLALKPTLVEIIKLPGAMASGEAAGGGNVVKGALRRVVTEFQATVATLGGLLLVTVVSAVILGFIVAPALKALLEYFSISVQYLQFVDGASSGVVFLTLFAVTLFVGLNMAAVILSSAFFLGKLQKVFQNKFTDGAPLATHKKFLIWGPLSFLWVQLFPLLFLLVAQKALAAINDKILDGVANPDEVNWKMLLVAGPLFLVIGFIILFWAARGMKALGFMLTYQVKPKPPKAPKA
jgi:hypothetical protein